MISYLRSVGGGGRTGSVHRQVVQEVGQVADWVPRLLFGDLVQPLQQRLAKCCRNTERNDQFGMSSH